MPGCLAKAMASGAEREPGEMQTWLRPAAASSSTKVIANRWVTSVGPSLSDTGEAAWRSARLRRRRRGTCGDIPARLHTKPAHVGRGDRAAAHALAAGPS